MFGWIGISYGETATIWKFLTIILRAKEISATMLLNLTFLLRRKETTTIDK